MQYAVTEETMEIVWGELKVARATLYQLANQYANPHPNTDLATLRLQLERQRGVRDGMELLEMVLGNWPEDKR